MEVMQEINVQDKLAIIDELSKVYQRIKSCDKENEDKEVIESLLHDIQELCETVALLGLLSISKEDVSKGRTITSEEFRTKLSERKRKAQESKKKFES